MMVPTIFIPAWLILGYVGWVRAFKDEDYSTIDLFMLPSCLMCGPFSLLIPLLDSK